MSRRPTAADYRRRRAIAALILIAVISVIVIGAAVALGGGGSSDNAAPTTTVAPATTATAVVPPRVTAVGDSVMLGAANQLVQVIGADRTTVDAEESRQFSAGVDRIQEYKNRGELGDEVVVQLGTNGNINPDDFNRMMAILKPVRRVVILNTKVPRVWEDQVNETLANGAKRYKNIVLVDWHRIGTEHPEWFYDDGLHLRPEGAQAYAELVKSKL